MAAETEREGPASNQPEPTAESEQKWQEWRKRRMQEREARWSAELQAQRRAEQLETDSLMNYLETLKQAEVVIYTGYNGYGACSLMSVTNSNNLQARSIEPNTEVELMCKSDPDYIESQHPKLICIKPVVGADDWLGAIAVPIDQLHPAKPYNST